MRSEAAAVFVILCSTSLPQSLPTVCGVQSICERDIAVLLHPEIDPPLAKVSEEILKLLQHTAASRNMNTSAILFLDTSVQLSFILTIIIYRIAPNCKIKEKTACSRSFRLPSEPYLSSVAAAVKVKVRIGLSW